MLHYIAVTALCNLLVHVIACCDDLAVYPATVMQAARFTSESLLFDFCANEFLLLMFSHVKLLMLKFMGCKY